MLDKILNTPLNSITLIGHLLYTIQLYLGYCMKVAQLLLLLFSIELSDIKCSFVFVFFCLSDLKKTATKNLLGITIGEHLNFNEHMTNVYKNVSRKLNALSTNTWQMYTRMLAEKLMHCREYLHSLASNRKSLCQTLSLADISIIVLLFGCLVL